MKKLHGILFLVVAAVLFGIMPIWVKLAYTTGLNTFDVVLLRSLISAGILYVIIRHKGISFHIEKQQRGMLLFSGSVGYTGTLFTLYFSYNYIGAGVATSLHYLYPVLVMIMALVLFKEKLSLIKWIALIVSLSGIFLITGIGDTNVSLPGVTLALLSAVCFGIYVICVGHPLLKNINTAIMTYYVCIIAAFFSLLFIAVQGTWPQLTLMGLYYSILISIFCTILALILFNEGVKIVGASNASILSTLEPIVSLVAGLILLHEVVTWQIVSGCALVVGGVMLISWADLHGAGRLETTGKPPR